MLSIFFTLKSVNRNMTIYEFIYFVNKTRKNFVKRVKVKWPIIVNHIGYINRMP